MKKRLLPIALLAALGLVACGPTADPTTSTPETTTTPEVTDPSTTTPDEGPVVTSVTITNKADLQKEWHVNDLNDESRTVSIETAPKINLTAALKNGDLTVKSSDDTIIKASGKVLLPVKAGNVTITVSYKDSVSDTVEITLLEEVITPVIGLKALREGIADSTYKEDSAVDFYGQIYATAQQIDGQIHNGIWVGDGDYSMMLYAGKTSEAWFAEGLKIGDKVYAKGKLAPYNGLNEVKPDELRKMTAEDKYEVAAPTTLTVNADNFSAEGLANQDTRRFVAKDLIYVDGSIADVNSRATLNFKWVKDGKDIKVPLSINYHIGPEAMGELKAVTDNLAPGVKVDLEGVISWFNAPQLELQFLGDKTPAQCIKVAVQPDPNKLTISGPTEVAATESIELKVAAEPEGASPASTWTVDNEEIATIDDNGKLTGVKEGTVIVTATSKKVPTLTATYTVTVTKAPVKNGPTISETPLVGTYKLGTFHGNKGVNKMIYLNGTINDNRYLATTDVYEDGANFTIAEVEGGYTITVNNKYLGLVEKEFTGNNGPYKALAVEFLDTAFTWTFNAELKTFSYKVEIPAEGENPAEIEEYVIGTRNDRTFTTLSAGKVNPHTKGNFNLGIVDYVVNPTATTIAEGEFYLGFQHTNLDNRVFYLNGKKDGNYLATTECYAEAAKATVAAVEGGYTVKIGDKYLAFTTYVYNEETKAGVSYVNDPFVLTYNETLATFTATLKLGKGTLTDTVKAFGTKSSGTYTTISSCDADATKSCMLALYEIPAKLPSPLGITISADQTTLEAGKTLQLTTTITPSGANSLVTWSSSDETKATVDANGVVTGVAAGDVTITATSVDSATVSNTIALKITAAPEGSGNVNLTKAMEKVGDKNVIKTITEGPVTMACTGNSEVKFYTGEVRAYGVASKDQHSITTFSVAEGKNIESITMNDAKDSSKSLLKSGSAVFGNATATVDNGVVTLTPVDPTLPITITANAQVRFSNVTVYYVAA